MRKCGWFFAALALLVVIVSFPAEASAAGVQARVYCHCRLTSSTITVGKIFFTPAVNQGGCYNPIASLSSLLDQCKQEVCGMSKCKGKQVWAKVNTFCGYPESGKSTCPAD